MRAPPQDILQDLRKLTINERNLLDLIWRSGPISRKSLAELAGLTGASATRLTKRVLSLGIVEESVHLAGTVGTPIRPLNRSHAKIFSVGISFSKTSISFAVIDLLGEIHESIHEQVDEITLPVLVDFVGTCIRKSFSLNQAEARLLGVGIALPGYRATSRGHWAVHWDFPGLLSLDMEKELTQQLGVPVFAERDAQASAWAERMNGKGRSLQSFCVIYLAQGVGGAVMSDGRMMSGKHGNAGGLGILFPYDQPRPSARDLEVHLEKHSLSLESLDPTNSDHAGVLDAWINAVVPRLRTGFNHIARLYDPEMIILSGPLPRFILDRLVIAAEYRQVETSYSAELPCPRVSVSDITDNSLLQGAACLPLAHIFYPESGREHAANRSTASAA